MVKYIPITIGVIGILLGSMKDPDKDFAYWLGVAFGIFIIASVPGALFGTIHYLLVKNKKPIAIELEDDFIDMDEEQSPKAKYSWYYYYCCYLGGFGALFILISILQIVNN